MECALLFYFIFSAVFSPILGQLTTRNCIMAATKAPGNVEWSSLPKATTWRRLVREPGIYGVGSTPPTTTEEPMRLLRSFGIPALYKYALFFGLPFWFFWLSSVVDPLSLHFMRLGCDWVALLQLHAMLKRPWHHHTMRNRTLNHDWLIDLYK